MRETCTSGSVGASGEQSPEATRQLRCSEDEAYRRVAAARLVRRFPALLDSVASGELHLTGLLVLAPHLTEQNIGQVLLRAKHRTKKEIARLVRELDPLPEVPPSLSDNEAVSARAGAGDDGQPPPAEPLSPQRYKVQFTAGEEYVKLVEEAQALLSHSAPRATLDENPAPRDARPRGRAQATEASRSAAPTEALYRGKGRRSLDDGA
jgi:hypothetical protein